MKNAKPSTDKQAQVIKLLAAYPELTLSQAAKRCGVSRAYVSRIRTDFKLKPQRPAFHGELSLTMKQALSSQVKLMNWLENNKPVGVDMATHIVSILIDAMHDDLEQTVNAKEKTNACN